MSMTEEQIAEVIHAWATGYDQIEEAQLVADLFANRLTETNPNFDRQRFIDMATGERVR